MEWSFRVVCSGGKYWSDIVGLPRTKTDEINAIYEQYIN